MSELSKKVTREISVRLYGGDADEVDSENSYMLAEIERLLKTDFITDLKDAVAKEGLDTTRHTVRVSVTSERDVTAGK